MNGLKLLALFSEGVLSFFSPCVLPILPVYLGILGGQADAVVAHRPGIARKRLLTNTLFFAIGIALTFFILGFASSLFSRFLLAHLAFFRLIGGGLILLFGLFQLGVFHLSFLNRELSARQRVYRPGRQMTPLLALLLGFTFSFSWTPCIGPILASVFLYASSHQGWAGLLLIGLYSLGFILPFLLVAVFSERLLITFRKYNHILKYTKLVSGVLLLVIGFSILTGSFANLSRIFS